MICFVHLSVVAFGQHWINLGNTFHMILNCFVLMEDNQCHFWKWIFTEAYFLRSYSKISWRWKCFFFPAILLDTSPSLCAPCAPPTLFHSLFHMSDTGNGAQPSHSSFLRIKTVLLMLINTLSLSTCLGHHATWHSSLLLVRKKQVTTKQRILKSHKGLGLNTGYRDKNDQVYDWGDKRHAINIIRCS
jgi:hypothetical protein